MSQILVVDDEQSICWALSRALTSEGHAVQVAASAEEAFLLARQQPPELTLLDVRLPGMDGLSAMQRLAELTGGAPIIVMTAFGNLETAVAAVRNGATEYLIKPFDLDAVTAVVRRALDRPPATVRAELPPASPADAMIGHSPAMQEVFKRIALVAATDVAVLITGESGAGKELAARAIHRHSARAALPLTTVHLAALSPTLIESELFGHVRGAFTGADAPRRGLLEQADQATVFLDEAAEIPPPAQVKLLRALEQQEVTPVGDNQPRPARFRLISATNRDLIRMVQEGKFREDLYFRLAGFEIHLPPLRERVEDIPLLAERFLQSERLPAGTQASFTREALAELCRRAWPGNVRELRQTVEQAAVVARGGPIRPEHLPPPREMLAPAGESGPSLAGLTRQWTLAQFAAGGKPSDLYQQFLGETEPALFQAVLEKTGQNQSAAAELLGIHRATLRKRLGNG